ncbi:MAG TPA: VOC family protein [Dehalococcoidia bacterium]|jgi:predicted enzyme related to lactoylglutathione lyase|nr:VOC family protein [Dehalococcoidia bacterium]
MAEDWARPVVHWDLQARDPQKQREFYAEMFNWQIGDAPLMSVPAGIGGPPPEFLSGNILQSEHAGISLYVQVLDLRKTLDRTPSLGGTVLSQPIDIPNGPTLATITDPEGNRLVLVQQ